MGVAVQDWHEADIILVGAQTGWMDISRVESSSGHKTKNEWIANS